MDAAGEPTGVLREESAWRFRGDASPSRTTSTSRPCGQGSRLAHARGVTAVHDKDGWLGAAPPLAASPGAGRARRCASGSHCRTSASSELEALGLRSGIGDDWLRLGYLKAFMDGALGSEHRLAARRLGSAASRAARSSPRSYGGRPASGWPVAVHAIGDRANREALDAFEATREEWAPRGLRQRIEHAQCVDPEDLPRFAALGVACSVQFSHAPSDRDLAERCWADRFDGAYAYRALWDTGALLANGSDAPIEELDPLAGHPRGRAADARRARRLAPAAGADVEQALAATTVVPAWLAGDERRRGKLVPGCLADLVVLDRDPVTCRRRRASRGRESSRRWWAGAGCTIHPPGRADRPPGRRRTARTASRVSATMRPCARCGRFTIEECAVACTADIIGSKWTAVIVHDLSEGPRRFSELERACPGISPRTLSERLDMLESQGIVGRQSYPESPPRVEYELTAKGAALLPIIQAMSDFGHAWLVSDAEHARRTAPARHERQSAERPSSAGRDPLGAPKAAAPSRGAVRPERQATPRGGRRKRFRRAFDRALDVVRGDVEVGDRAEQPRRIAAEMSSSRLGAGAAAASGTVSPSAPASSSTKFVSVSLRVDREPTGRQTLGEPAGVGVVVGEALDVVIERDRPGRGDDPRLAHRTAEEMLVPAGLRHRAPSIRRERAQRAAEALREAERHRVELAAVVGGGNAARNRRVHQPRTVEMDREPVLRASAQTSRNEVERPDLPPPAVVGVLETEHPGRRQVDDRPD